MILVLSILLFILSILFKKSKVLAGVILIYSWLLFGFNTMNGDYELYERMYIESTKVESLLSYEAGYKLLMFIGNSMGLSFQDFFKLIAAIILGLLGFVSFKYSKFPALFLSIFLIVYLPIEYVLLRNFLAFSFVLIGLVSYFNGDRKSKVILLSMILVATTIHISSLFYLLIYFALYYGTIKASKVFMLTIVSLLCFSILNSIMLKLIGNVGGRESMYLTKLPQFIIYSFIQVVNYFLIFWFFNSNKKVDINVKSIIISINLYLIFLIVIYFNYAIFIRIFLNLSIFNVLIMLNNINIKGKWGIERAIVLVFYLSFFFFEFVYPVMDDSLYPLYENNSFFK